MNDARLKVRIEAETWLRTDRRGPARLMNNKYYIIIIIIISLLLSLLLLLLLL